VARAVQISAQRRRRLPDRADPNRLGRFGAVADNAVCSGARGHPGQSVVPRHLGERRRNSRAGFHDVYHRRARAPALGGLVLFDCDGRSGASRPNGGYLHWHGVDVLPDDPGDSVLRQWQLRSRRRIHGGAVADATTNERHGLVIRGWQSGQDYRSTGIGADRRFVRLHQPQGNGRCLSAGFPLLRLVVGTRRCCFPVHRLRDQGPLVRGDGRGARRAGGRTRESQRE